MKFTLIYSKKDSDKESIYLRHRFSLNGKESEVKIKTGFSIARNDWDDYNECWDISQRVRSPRKPEDKVRNKTIDDFNNEFGTFKINIAKFLSDNPYPTRQEVQEFIFGKKENAIIRRVSEYPVLFSDFVDFYIKEKSVLIPGKQIPITLRTEQRYIQIKTKVDLFFPKLKITEIDDDFRDGYAAFMHSLNYKSSFIIKELKFIKMFCRYAHKKLDVNKEVLYWEFRNTETDKYTDPTFSFEELQAIHNLELRHGSYLDNARDWLLISCYTGQRVSDLLTMNSSGIIEEEFYELKQQKGQKTITIWLMPEVMAILNKRKGEFPRKISNVRYNEYIKEVAEKAKIIGVIKGAKQIDKRKVTGFYPKNELVTSHIGRRTFVSLFKPFIGMQNVQGMTGHATEAMVNLYDKTQGLDIAKRVKLAFQGLNYGNKSV